MGKMNLILFKPISSAKDNLIGIQNHLVLTGWSIQQIIGKRIGRVKIKNKNQIFPFKGNDLVLFMDVQKIHLGPRKQIMGLNQKYHLFIKFKKAGIIQLWVTF